MSGSLCVCARSLLIAETERAANNQKEIRGITVGRLATGQYWSEY